MSIKEGIKYFIKPSVEEIKVLFLGEPLSVINELLPNAIVYYLNISNDKILKFSINYFDIILDHNYLIYTNNLKAFEPIYKLLKCDGVLLGIGYDKENIGISKDYMLFAKYSLFDNFNFNPSIII